MNIREAFNRAVESVVYATEQKYVKLGWIRDYNRGRKPDQGNICKWVFVCEENRRAYLRALYSIRAGK